MVGDVGDVETARAAVEVARSRFGRLDVLVNAAGFGPPMPLVDLTEDVWDATIDSCLTGVYLMTRAALPLLLDAGSGAIVNVSSIAGKGAEANRTAYCAAKWGLQGFSLALRAELSGRVCASTCSTRPAWRRTGGTSRVTRNPGGARPDAGPR